jgi:hypothetical protein
MLEPQLQRTNRPGFNRGGDEWFALPVSVTESVGGIPAAKFEAANVVFQLGPLQDMLNPTGVIQRQVRKVDDLATQFRQTVGYEHPRL